MTEKPITALEGGDAAELAVVDANEVDPLLGSFKSNLLQSRFVDVESNGIRIKTVDFDSTLEHSEQDRVRNSPNTDGLGARAIHEIVAFTVELIARNSIQGNTS
jgi:hypothetical protein